jgi:DnaK suppressor protein
MKKPLKTAKSAKKSPPKKTPQKKLAPKKPVAKKTEPKKTLAKKSLPKKSLVKKPLPKKSESKKIEPKKAHPSKNEFDEFQSLLEAIRGRLRGDVTQLTNEALGADRGDMGSESKSPTHMAELGSETFEQDFALSLVENEQETLAEIGAALEKIKDGTYGLCEACLVGGKNPSQAAIPKARLRAIPYARNCVACERIKERY